MKSPAIRVVSATEAKNRFGEMIRHAYQDAAHLIIQRDGIPVVAILPMADYERWRTPQTATAEDQATSQAALSPLVGLSEAELRALAQAVIAPERQSQLHSALVENRNPVLTDTDRLALDDVLERLLEEVDQLALLKARALYTLQQRRRSQPDTPIYPQ